MRVLNLLLLSGIEYYIFDKIKIKINKGKQ